MGDSSLAFVKTESIGSCLIISNYCNSISHVIWFDPFNGHPMFFGISGFDTFPNERDALQLIEKLNKIESVSYAKYLIGIHKILDSYLILTVVKDAKKIGVILGQHQVYSVNDVEYWVILLKNDIKPDYNLAEKKIMNFKSFPVLNNHFFSPTFNLTAALGFPSDNSMVWNLTLSTPFKKFEIPCCIELIQGCFSIMPINEDTTIFAILRRRCTDSGPIIVSKGLSQNGSVGNEVEIEFILQNRINGVYRTMSYFMRRCSSPVSPGTHCPSSTEESCMHAPVFLHRLVELYRMKRIYIVDLSHSQQCSGDNLKGDATVSVILKKVISFISKMFDISLFQFDWINQCQIDVFGAAEELLSMLIPVANQIGVNSAVWVNDIPNFSTRQNGFCVLSCQTGFDQSSVASYIVGLYSFAIMFNEIHFISNLPQNFQRLRSLNQNLSSFLGDFFLLSGRIIGQIYCGSSFFHERELIALANLKPRVFVFSLEQIKDKRKKFNLNYDNYLFFTEFKNESESALSFCSNDCVSVFPGAQIISPSHDIYMIFSLYQNSLCSIKSDSPVIVSLSRPCQITQIVFKIKKQAGKKNDIILRTPSSVSVFGGMYLNRLFTLFEDFSLLHSENSKYLRLANSLHNSYDTEIHLNCIEKVRYLQFWFHSTSENVTISNIYVYGNIEAANLSIQSFSQSVPQNVSLPPPIESAAFLDIVSSESIIKWEERRLCANLTFKSFIKPMIERGLNPFHMTLSHIMNLNETVFNHNKYSSKFCCTCRSRPAILQCGMCSKLYCSICTSATEVKEIKEGTDNKLIVAKICKACFSSRTMVAKIIPRFELLKKRMIKNKYPFIGNFTELFDGRAYRNNDSNLVGAVFISEPPADRNKCFLAENILDINNTIEWSPAESMVAVSVLLKQRTNLQKIGIRCNSPLKLLLNEQEYVFSPPMTEHSIDSNNIASVLHLTLIGFPIIIIKKLLFFGQPALLFPTVKQSIVRKDKKVNEIPSSNTFYENDRIKFSFGRHAFLYGVYFDLVAGDQTIVFEIESDSKKVYVPLHLPRGRFARCVVELPEYYKVKSFNLWFSTSVDALRNKTITPLYVSYAKTPKS